MLNNVRHYLGYRMGLVSPITQTSENERAMLRNYASEKKALAEIGVFHGVNTRMFCEVMDKNAFLLAIDPFQRSFFGIRGYGWARKIAHREVAKVNRERVIWVEDFGYRASSSHDVRGFLPLDFIFIDGDHSYDGLRGDWEAWKNHISVGGIVALHDSDNCNGCGSEQFTKEVILHCGEFKKIAAVESLTVLQRI